MVEMTHYEINRRLAEIAGKNVWRTTFPSGRYGLCFPTTPKRPQVEWSPLTNWSQLGPLMERFVYALDRCEYDNPGRYWFVSTELGDRDEAVRDPDLKRAICLAIIAAHESDQ